MLQRYLGNKNVLLQPILDAVASVSEPGDIVCDAFSGSIAVSVGLKSQGYRVATNDVNLLSWVYATAYLANSNLPEINLARILGRSSKKTAPSDDASWGLLISHLVSERDKSLPKSAWRTDFFDHYCEEGRLSAFKSSRGRTGRRRFFSSENAQAIDRALSRIRCWTLEGRINEDTRCILTSCLLDALERVCNIQGTYHDFPRDFYDPRALRRIALKLPDRDLMAGRTDHIIGRGEDSLEFVNRIPRHKVLYLDPPYNFRQYTSYYFLPNLVARYPDIANLDEYFEKIDFVRGQNMEDDFSSTFCKAGAFISSLQQIIERASCEYVLMSYFDGKNHWSDFKSSKDSKGKKALEAFFSSELFEAGTANCSPVKRLNYQSYGGYQARNVTEFLFSAKKKPASKLATLDRSLVADAALSTL